MALKLPPSFVYLSIRLFTLGLRFLFVALFFKYSETLYGEFGLVATTIMLGVYILGMDFYMYSNREILSPDARTRHIFLNQLIFHGILYVLLLPGFYLFFRSGFLDKSYLIVFYLILIAEHLSFEVNRLLFVMKKPLAANINLFFRNGFWVIPLLFYFFSGKAVSIRTVLMWWLAGDLLSWIPVLVLLDRGYVRKLKRFRPDLEWIKKGFYVSFPFFMATLSFKAIEFSDRYFIDYFFDKATVGVYTFFGNMSYLVNTIVYTAVISLLFPEIVQHILSGDKMAFFHTFSVFKRKTIRWTISISALVLVSMPVLLLLLDKKMHLNNYPVFVLLVLANVFFNLSFIYHFVLYGYRRDRLLVTTAITGMTVNLLLNFITIPIFGMAGAALSTLVAFGIIFGIKYYYGQKMIKEIGRKM